jgi:phosphatidylglycerophosphate synthase
MAILADEIFGAPHPGPSPTPLMRDAAGHLALFGGVLALAVLACMATATLTWRGCASAFICYAVMSWLVLAGLTRHAHPDRFGLANAITLGRAALTALLFGVAGEWLLGGIAMLGTHMRWLLAGGAALILVLDGLDGPAARRSGMASPFGARFDMEADALFVVVLSLVAVASGAVGFWLLASAGMRYAFLAAMQFDARLAAPLPPLMRRKMIYVVQAGAPIIALLPICPPAFAWTLCIAAFALIAYSFAADMVWLLSRDDELSSSVALGSRTA